MEVLFLLVLSSSFTRVVRYSGVFGLALFKLKNDSFSLLQSSPFMLILFYILTVINSSERKFTNEEYY